jgi:asparagine synthase (glutamine-hydrolysing)
MANSLEGRSPMLDHEVMEFAARLPAKLKLRGGRSKFIITTAFADLLPRENVERRKMGFGMPVGDWLRGPMREMLGDILLSERSLGRGYFVPDEVRRLVTEHWSRRADHTYRLWNLLMLELWHREVLERPTFPVPRARTPHHTRSQAGTT